MFKKYFSFIAKNEKLNDIRPDRKSEEANMQIKRLL
tara:strand:+ start:4848 stop:4955 length:108 start_codon:yes stop_codon:yes gene_type:complete